MDTQRDELPKALKGHPAIEAALTTWIPYYADRFLELETFESAWQAASQEYRFTLRAQRNKSEALDLSASHAGEALDWYAFDISYKKNEGTPKISKAVSTVIPTALGYAGMPASRLWEIEDGSIHLRKVLGRLKTDWDLEVVGGGDHSFRILKSSGISQQEVHDHILQKTVDWLKAKVS